MLGRAADFLFFLKSVFFERAALSEGIRKRECVILRKMRVYTPQQLLISKSYDQNKFSFVFLIQEAFSPEEI